MRELNERDLRILKKGFLESLNNAANGDEDKCFEKSQIFENSGLKAFSPLVIPPVVQELEHEGLIEECESKDEVKITLKGKQRLTRNDEGNSYTILKTITKYGSTVAGLSGKRLQELTELTPSEINDAVALLKQSNLE
jgi:predicted transcriptional regulator